MQLKREEPFLRKLIMKNLLSYVVLKVERLLSKSYCGIPLLAFKQKSSFKFPAILRFRIAVHMDRLARTYTDHFLKKSFLDPEDLSHTTTELDELKIAWKCQH